MIATNGHIWLMSSVFCEYKNYMHTFRLGREERRGKRERERQGRREREKTFTTCEAVGKPGRGSREPRKRHRGSSTNRESRLGSGANEGARLSLSVGAGVLYYIGWVSLGFSQMCYYCPEVF